MRLSVAEAERIVRDGAEALRAGKAGEASRLFGQVAAAGLANPQVWLLLAHSSRLAGDAAEAEQAADAVLHADARNLRALLIKGDCRREAGDDRAAASFYKAATAAAAQAGEVPADLAAELERVRKANQDIESGFRRQLTASLASAGFAGEAPSPRFRQSIDILLGEKQVYLQQPTAYFFPGLPQIQFYDRSDFPWADAIEYASDDMRAELEAALAADAPFKPYLQASKDRPRSDFHGMLDNPAWSTLYLWENGGAVEQNIALFPKTFAALEQAPMPHITTRAPSILFSLLKPGARIAPHHGMINTRLICHLPLIVPPGCGFRCGNEVREWEPGKLLIFDDTIEHEAWNESAEDRVVLIFDVWRPELTDEERRAVGAIFEAIDQPSN